MYAEVLPRCLTALRPRAARPAPAVPTLEETTTQGVVARRLDTLTLSTAVPSAPFHHAASPRNSSCGGSRGAAGGALARLVGREQQGELFRAAAAATARRGRHSAGSPQPHLQLLLLLLLLLVLVGQLEVLLGHVGKLLVLVVVHVLQHKGGTGSTSSRTRVHSEGLAQTGRRGRECAPTAAAARARESPR